MTSESKDKIPVVVLLTPKWIISIGKVIQKISKPFAIKFATWLFTKTLRYPLPKRELTMYNQSKKQLVQLWNHPEKIQVYNYGNGKKKILLVHGWAGSGTQLATIAAQLLVLGYSVVSFDAPGHGKAPGKSSMIPHFVSAIQQLAQTHGPFEYAIGHSLGGMSLLRTVREGLRIKKLIIIGTANSLTTIITNFVKNMQLSPGIAQGIKQYFDQTLGSDIDEFSGAVSARYTTIPILVIHERDDVDVAITAAYEIHEELSKGSLYITQGLGQRKILGDPEVIRKITNFIQEEEK